MTPTPLDLDALVRVAEAATPGARRLDYDRNDQACIYGDGEHADTWIAMLPHQCVKAIEEEQERNAAYMVTFDPPTILALCAELAQARAVVVVARESAAASTYLDADGQPTAAGHTRLNHLREHGTDTPTDRGDVALLLAELRAIEAFRAEPFKAMRNILGEDDSDDEAIAGSICAVLITRQETARRLRDARALLAEIRAFAEDRVDADCVGDPPQVVGNDWNTVVNMIDALTPHTPDGAKE